MTQSGEEFEKGSPAQRVEFFAHAEDHGRVFQALGNLFVSEVHHHYSEASAVTVLAAQVVVEEIANWKIAPGFVGRKDEQDRILRALNPSTARPEAVLVSAVSGMAGIGKTALARRVAAAAAGRDWFPGGVFLVDFHGYAAPHIEAASVFGPLLHAMGVPVDQVPLDSAAQSACFHRLLTERARREMPVLLVWDNIYSSDQISGLIPGLPHRALITSRHSLADVEGVRTLNLDVLDRQQAVSLMREALRRQDPEDTRIESEPEQADRVAELCGGLPLALRIAAALLAEDTSFTVGGLADRLASASARLNELSYGDNWAVRRTFDSSYGHLSAEQSRVFRLLALNPGPHVSLGAAAVLAELPESQARQVLAGLHRAHLVELGPNHATYRFHDLLRIYAVEYCQAEESTSQRMDAFRRLLDHYLAMSRSAISHLDPMTATYTNSIFTDRDSALAWLETERANLIAAIVLAAGTGDHTHTRDLSLCLNPFFDLRKYWADWTSTHKLALAATRQLNDRAGEGIALNNLGRAYRELRQFDEAVDYLEQALSLYEEIGDLHGQGLALNNVGNIYGELGRLDESIERYRRAQELFGEVGDRHMQGRTLNNLGNDYAKLGRLQDAIVCHQQALEIFKDSRNTYGEAHVLDSLGNDYRDLQQLDDSIRCHLAALSIFREIGERYGEGRALVNLSVAHAKGRQLETAIEYGLRALSIFQEVDDRYGEGYARINLGMARAEMSQFNQAADDYREAQSAFQDASAPDEAGRARALLEGLPGHIQL